MVVHRLIVRENKGLMNGGQCVLLEAADRAMVGV